jgi:ABC-2 type transport system ATP-binding protein
MPIIEVSNVVKSFGNYKAVNNVSFNVEKGRIFGLLGPNGAGKTTTIRMLTNIFLPDSGTINILGKPTSAEIQNHLGYLPEERGLYKRIKVIEQLVYFAQLKGVGKREALKKAQFWLKELGASGWENKKIQELSKGMQQKVQFISTILHDPEVMILDEPFSGFDPINTELLKNIVLELKDSGKTIILSTHVMEQVEQLCDEIALINKGQAVLTGNVRDIKASFGRDTVVVEFDGDGSFADDIENIKVINKSNSRVEFRITDGDFDTRKILDKILKKAEILKFELVEPSLHQIFIQTVNQSNQPSEAPNEQ